MYEVIRRHGGDTGAVFPSSIFPRLPMAYLTDPAVFERAFIASRTANLFIAEPVTEDALHALYNAARFGPTSMNCQPMRLVFGRSAEAKVRLREALAPGNV